MGARTLIGGFNINDYPFKNFFKNMTSLQASGGTYGYPAILDANGYPTSTPASTVFGATVTPPSYAGHWVIKWTGTGRINLAPGQSPNTGLTIHSGRGFVVGNTRFNMTVDGTNPRVEFSYNGVPTGIALNFTTTGTYSGMTGAVLCRLADEAILDASSDPEDMFNQDFIDELVTLNPKIIRPMGWCGINDGNFTSKSTYRPALTQFTFQSVRWEPRAWVGTISGTDTYTCGTATDTPGSWTAGEMFQGQFTNANASTTPTINVNGRGAKTIVNAYAAALTAGDIAANSLATFTYDGDLDKVIWTRDGMVASVPVAVLTGLANKVGCDLWYNFPNAYDDASVAADVSYIRDNLNSGRTAYFEYSNEIWNFASSFPQTSWAVQKGIVFRFTSDNDRRLHGWYGKRVREIMEIATSTWSSRNNNELKRVMAFFAWAFPPSTSTYRLQGADLTLGNIGIDYANFPNRPIDYCDVLSYATYYSGAQCRNFDANYGTIQDSKSIMAIAKANPAVVTVSSHGYSNGDIVTIANVGGMTQVNGVGFVIGNVTTDTFELTGIDSSDYGAYTSGGTAARVLPALTDLLTAAENYHSGVEARKYLALDWLDRDIRAGQIMNTSSVLTLGGETMKALNDNVYPGWQKIAASFNKDVACYEGGCEVWAPSGARLTTFGIDAGYSTKIATLITAYKNNYRFFQLVIDQFNQVLSQANTTVPAWLLLAGPNQWGVRTGDLYSSTYKSWDAQTFFNSNYVYGPLR